MTLHRSLKSRARRGHRNVLKRFERIKALREKEKWDETHSVFGLPKVKSVMRKMKKVKAEKPEEKLSPEAEVLSEVGEGEKEEAGEVQE